MTVLVPPSPPLEFSFPSQSKKKRKKKGGIRKLKLRFAKEPTSFKKGWVEKRGVQRKILALVICTYRADNLRPAEIRVQTVSVSAGVNSPKSNWHELKIYPFPAPILCDLLHTGPKLELKKRTFSVPCERGLSDFTTSSISKKLTWPRIEEARISLTIWFRL